MSKKPFSIDAAKTSGPSPTDTYSVQEFADLLDFPVSAVLKIIERRKKRAREFYTITELAKRWDCSRTKVYEILRESELKVFNIAGKSNKQRDAWRVSRPTVEHIEQTRADRLPEVEVASEDVAA